MTQELDRLAARLEKLERQNRRLKLGGGALAVGLGLLGLTAAAGPLCDVVSAERFVLHDARGKTRMTLDAYHTEPVITLQDKAGKAVARFGVGEDGQAYLVTLDEKGKARCNLFEAAGGAQKSANVDDDPSIAMR